MRSRRSNNSAISRAAGSSRPRALSGPFPDSSSERDRNDRISKVRWLLIFAFTTALASVSARWGSAKSRYWLTRSMTFLVGAGWSAATNRP
jgi:hypothetical protein